MPEQPSVKLAPSPFVLTSTAGAPEGVPTIHKPLRPAVILPSPKIQIGAPAQ